MMSNIVGIRFKKAGKVYYFDPVGIELQVNDHVIVETTRGLELGEVVIAPSQVVLNEADKLLKPVIRKAGPEDITRAQELEAREKEALTECGKLIEKLNLPMKLLAASYNLDGNYLTFYFSAEERVDFRELVRELAGRFKVKVEMRQMGPRDEAKMIGGLGRCGRTLCCASFLCDFDPVSIRMAKDQDLPLNPMKISGCCGRLMCCLVYESEFYHEMKGKMPKVGQQVMTPSGEARVVENNALKETVTVALENEVTVEFPLSQITFEPRKPSEPRPKKQPEENLEEPENGEDKQTENVEEPLDDSVNAGGVEENGSP